MVLIINIICVLMIHSSFAMLFCFFLCFCFINGIVQPVTIFKTILRFEFWSAKDMPRTRSVMDVLN